MENLLSGVKPSEHFTLTDTTAANGAVTFRLTLRAAPGSAAPRTRHVTLQVDNLTLRGPATQTVTLRNLEPVVLTWTARRRDARAPWVAVVVYFPATFSTCSITRRRLPPQILAISASV